MQNHSIFSIFVSGSLSILSFSALAQPQTNQNNLGMSTQVQTTCSVTSTKNSIAIDPIDPFNITGQENFKNLMHTRNTRCWGFYKLGAKRIL